MSCRSLSFLLAVATAIAARAEGEYEVIDLGTLGGSNSAATAINDHGQVVGWAHDAAGRPQAFRWQNGIMTGLGFLPGGTSSYALAINNAGDITGYAAVSPTNQHAFLFASNSLVDIGTLGGPVSQGRGINDQGVIAGSSRHLADTSNHSFAWQAGRFTEILPYINYSSCDAFGINAASQVCGITFLWATNDRWWAYVWFDANTNGVHDAGEMQVLGSLGVIFSFGSLSSAYAINDIGQAVGFTGVSNGWYPQHAFLVTSSNGQWKVPAGSPDPTNSLMRDLGVLGGPTNNSWARGINNQTWIVGNADLPASPAQAFLWRNGVMTNLNHLITPGSGWVLTNATGINEHNEIVGSGLLNGQSRGFVLRQQGRISRLEPVVQTNLWVYTNEFAEVVTQATEQVAGHVLHWGGIWGGVNTTRVFTVEACDSLPASNWAPVLPTAQWPIVEFTWTNTDLGSAATRFYRVRAE